MIITLEKATSKDARTLHALQVKSFLPLLKKYNDEHTNPACEPLEKTLSRINDPSKEFYKILKDNVLVGGVAIKYTVPEKIFLGPLFIDPDYQNQKIAQETLKLMETAFPDVVFFELATISKEKGNIHLYEKMGYLATGEVKRIVGPFASFDVIFFRKIIKT
ncbi:MAG: GNAT family N-acetyltransferase [Parachlamydiaceae bacterium]|nr:GNAT family N-acetyltransferase [Parachlamydiaceae bacterium]